MTDQAEPTPSTPADDAAPTGEVIAKPANYYRMTRVVMSLAFIAMGLWFGYDGWVGWPRENVKYDEVANELERVQTAKKNDPDPAKQQGYTDKIRDLSKEQEKYKKHTNMDLLFQKILCLTLPPLGLAMLIWAFYNSRGTYRLAGTTLHVPGHPAVPLDDITRIDKRQWDRKGIAYLDYETGGAKGTIKLDDFVYDRPPTDEIFARVEKYARTSR